MNIQEYTKMHGSFLKSEDVEAHPKAEWEITGEGDFVTSKKFGNERLHLPIKDGEDERVFDMSKTNARTVEEVLGTDTVKWIGSKLILETYKTKTSDGKMTLAINVKEVKKIV